MRERTTWNRSQIKSAAMTRQADPYLMNQDHVNNQPKADDYVTGTPSDFAEDVDTSNRWEEEYKGDAVNRNEIGMPEFRGDTFKTASEALLLKKADLCVKTARIMLGSKAVESAVEDQAYSLMYLPDAELIHTFDRLAGDQSQDDEEEGQAQQKQAQDQDQGDDEETQEKQEQKKQAAQLQLAEQCAQALQQGQLTQAQDMLQQMVQQAQGQQGQSQFAEDVQQQQAQGQQQVAQGQQQVQAEQIQQMVQQALQQGQQQVAQGQGQQQVAQGQQPVADDLLLDDMLAPDPMMDDMGMGMGMDVEMDPAPMDVGEMVLGPEDDVLRTLFAAEGQEQEEQEEQSQGQAQQKQEQKKQASMRTASTRTVGTRPTQGVSRVGGSATSARGGDVDRLSALWPTSPDVSGAFGMK
jgi:hypothetical protein